MNKEKCPLFVDGDGLELYSIEYEINVEYQFNFEVFKTENFYGDTHLPVSQISIMTGCVDFQGVVKIDQSSILLVDKYEIDNYVGMMVNLYKMASEKIINFIGEV